MTNSTSNKSEEELRRLNKEGLIGTQIKRDILEAELKGFQEGKQAQAKISFREGRTQMLNEVKEKIEYCSFIVLCKKCGSRMNYIDEEDINRCAKCECEEEIEFLNKKELLSSLDKIEVGR